MGWNRDPRKLQPEVCDVTGRAVPVEDMVLSTVDGLDGALVGNSTRFEARVRYEPSYEDLRNLQIVPQEEWRKGPTGSARWYKGEGLPDYVPDPVGLIFWGKPPASAGLSGATWADSSGNGNHLTMLDLGAGIVVSGDEIENAGGVFGWIYTDHLQVHVGAPTVVPTGTAYIAALLLCRQDAQKLTSSDPELMSVGGATLSPLAHRLFFEAQQGASRLVHHSDLIRTRPATAEMYFNLSDRSFLLSNGMAVVSGRDDTMRGVFGGAEGMKVGASGTGTIDPPRTYYSLLVWARTAAQGPLPTASRDAAREYMLGLSDEWKY